MDKIKHGSKLQEANEAGQKPPTDANATRQRYQLGCHTSGGGGGNSNSSSNSRIKTRSRQFNRGSGY